MSIIVSLINRSLAPPSLPLSSTPEKEDNYDITDTNLSPALDVFVHRVQARERSVDLPIPVLQMVKHAVINLSGP